MTADERDPILERLREVDPARVESGDEPLVRAGVKRRVESALSPPDRGRRTRRAGLVVAGAGVLAVVVAIMFGGGGGGGLAPGPEPALAIEKAPNSVTLTIDDPAAGADEMNRELETAGIDRVRVVSVPGSPNHAGTWAGSIDIGADWRTRPFGRATASGSPTASSTRRPHPDRASSISSCHGARRGAAMRRTR